MIVVREALAARRAAHSSETTITIAPDAAAHPADTSARGRTRIIDGAGGRLAGQHQVRAAYHSELISRYQFQVHIHVLDGPHGVRQLQGQLHGQRRAREVVLHARARRHQDAAFHELGVAPTGLAELGVVRRGQPVSRGPARVRPVVRAAVTVGSLHGWSWHALPQQAVEEPRRVPPVIVAAAHRILVTNAYDLPDLPTWHRDGMLVIGDAAHAASPATGQGASMALEDAVILAKALRDQPGTERAFAVPLP